MLGLLFALGANALNPDGLSLGTNYFPRAADMLPGLVTPGSTAPQPEPSTPVEVDTEPAVDTTAPATPADHAADVDPAVVQRLAEQGLTVIFHDDVVATWQDPAYQAGLYLFVDARDDQSFAEGHIPGALQYNHYQSEKYIGAVLPAAQQAAKVIVYCIGGNCEDSEYAAVNLMMAGVDASKLHIYVGGIAQWKAAGQPVETGP